MSKYCVVCSLPSETVLCKECREEEWVTRAPRRMPVKTGVGRVAHRLRHVADALRL